MQYHVNKAVFLDKDGTLIRDEPYNVDPAKVVFEDDVFEGLRTLQADGYRLVVVSNQPGLAMGLFSQIELDALIRYFEDVFVENGLVLSGFYYCPHLPASAEHGCECRKPGPGLLIQAAADLHIDLPHSWMIGDILHDVEAGNRAGCHTVLIDNGNETEWLEGPYRVPHYTTRYFKDAADYITTQTIAENDGE
ncbi:D,D-heptose 1,7-bisphosphate phosphatase [Dyadobacter sp. BE34]|uniref:D,D-heptose 1,7-bisphosphate phosphatase n=1 Tax=Dyadobacter fermentans TaxID=94254 RepID=A0ABU1QTL3_9BACT|nr:MULTISPECIES: HAD family hydrolase [Dyadobacter]MDR6804514.1 D,D-heptose 1,7-bisphosphate phosphatase [Dyadobacter fermentans]MDR7042254.1 D,D-heptose 1,7-bisphosphate phosphatase [Dyadobacter sp. BE242]MDR7196657.1 D,D-heptose 1,7-bisphosphate phosphatase [Dyadobacter sp. BE34]MDR7212798.1 D,D-heptose 1,7-bisphosphate phosphatase [Dyadobacter sp. BE31]MDR7262063.1 D,D-heptose 1,7-bisphosphate phosphatase [Dyadobacter sp. BE32]